MRKDGRTVTVFLTGGYCWHLFHWRFYDETREGRWNKQRLSLYGSVFFCILYLLCRILRIFQLYGPVFDGTRLQRHGLRNHHQPDISGKSSDGAGGGYITDTFLPTRRYLLLLIGMISALCIFCTKQTALLSAVFRYMGPLSGADAAVCQFCVLHECQRGVLCGGGG